MSAGQAFAVVVQRIEIRKLRHGDNLILGFSIGGGIDQDPGQNPFSDDKTDKTSQALFSAGGFMDEHKPLDSKNGRYCTGIDERRFSVWATLVHYRLRCGEREKGIHMLV
ncbi:tax1-binding protein 3 isoform X2 [Anarhichas minor]|uniref:tax1-binding protein 3 isoform X2 n=1 Tax=Anarhichas minor TaxID=65739 RepID=UPI003F737B09